MIEEKNEPTPLNKIGEFGLIDQLTSGIQLSQKTSVLGIGDDAAIIDNSPNQQKVISTDMLVEGVHFDLLYTPLKHLGYKAVVVNLSDIYAMNARPQQITVSIAVSNRMSLEGLEDLYEGIRLACEIYQVDLVGGDTTSSLSGMVISITALGEAKSKSIVRRSGAKENDLICLTGDLGAAYMGLQILEREKEIFNDHQAIQPDFSGKDYLLERQLKPEARKELLDFFEQNKIIPSSMIDVSDGLSSELIHLAKSSKVGIQIYESKIPIDPLTISTAEELNIDPSLAALNGGEDYELLFTIPLEHHEKILKLPLVSVIGHITEENAGYFMVGSGTETMIPLKAQGWDHGQGN